MLYEVITGCADFVAHVGQKHALGLVRPFGVLLGQLKIRRAVITSYSIHYTKLYDLPVRVFRSIEIFGVTAEHTPPDTGAVAHYGERISVVGIGLDPANLPLLLVGAAPPHVVRFAPAVVTDPSYNFV